MGRQQIIRSAIASAAAASAAFALPRPDLEAASPDQSIHIAAENASNSLEFAASPYLSDDTDFGGNAYTFIDSDEWTEADEEAFEALVERVALGDANDEDRINLRTLRERRVQWFAPRSLESIVREQEERERLAALATALESYYDYARSYGAKAQSKS